MKDIEKDIVLQISKKTQILDKLKNAVGDIKLSFGINFNLSTIFSLFDKDDFKDIIICFDDFERLSHKIKVKDLLGLISSLKEQKQCKVVLIFNKDKLHNTIPKFYKNKIIDYDFIYAPTPEEAYDIIKNTLKHYKAYPLEYFQTHNITNIRIMKRVINALNDYGFLEKSLEGYKDIEKLLVQYIKRLRQLMRWKSILI